DPGSIVASRACELGAFFNDADYGWAAASYKTGIDISVTDLPVDVEGTVAGMDDFSLDEFVRLFNVIGRSYVVVKFGEMDYVCTTRMNVWRWCAVIKGVPFRRRFNERISGHVWQFLSCDLQKRGNIKPKGSIFRFSSLDELNKFVVAIHGEGTYIQVAQMTVNFQHQTDSLRCSANIDMSHAWTIPLYHRDRLFLPSLMTPRRMKKVHGYIAMLVMESADENSLVERVFLRIGSAETDEQLETSLARFLPAVLLKLDSKEEGVRKKVMELLVHINKRLKSRTKVQLPVDDLIQTFTSQNATSILM
ncbi:hypothetical protein DPMN_105021, partial [Dreissena polymorpha]